jgi:hypothetical protein
MMKLSCRDEYDMRVGMGHFSFAARSGSALQPRIAFRFHDA